MRFILFEFKEGLLIALRALRANKVRTSLTMLGIFIGITVVVLMSTAIKGIDNSFQEIEVVRSASGKPEISLGGWTEKISIKKNIDQLTVSLSHSAEYAIATVIMTGN